MLVIQFVLLYKNCKQPKYPSVDEWIKKVVHLHNGILHGCKKKKILPFVRMDGPADYYAK